MVSFVNMKTQKFRRFGNYFLGLALLVSLSGCSRAGADLRAKYDLCFKEDNPGATERYVEFTPVRCSDRNIILGEPIGGEHASLEFADTDADGTSEIVVSSETGCRWTFEPCIAPTRTIVKVTGAASPVFTVVSSESLPGGEF